MHDGILAFVASQEISVGDKLPTEMEFCDSFGVSRPLVREALARLRLEGVIVTRKGSGSILRSKPGRDFLEMAKGVDVASMIQCFEFRMALECEAASLAAVRADRTDVARIGAALKNLEKSFEKGTLGRDEDFRFHRAILLASHNASFVSALDIKKVTIFQGINMARTLSLESSNVRTATVLQEHRAIYAAIVDGDPQLASAATRLHLANARVRLLSGRSEDTHQK